MAAACKGQRTDRVLFAYRIGDPNGLHPIYDAEGARLYPGRWNTEAAAVIYMSEHYSTALLEKLAHLNGLMPLNQYFARITIPNGASCEMFQPAGHPDARAIMPALPEPVWWDERLYR